MNKLEILEEIKGKTQDEIREFIINRLKMICDEAEKLFVEEEQYEKAGEIFKIKTKYHKK
jgi:hypothetical protein